MIVGSRSGWLMALHQSDGSLVWSRSNGFSWVESTGVVIDGTHYVGSSDLRAVRALSANTGALLCETDVLGFSWGKGKKLSFEHIPRDGLRPRRGLT